MRSASGHIGRVGLLAVTLGIGAAIAGATATANADTPTSNSFEQRGAHSSTTAPETRSAGDTSPSESDSPSESPSEEPPSSTPADRDAASAKDGDVEVPTETEEEDADVVERDPDGDSQTAATRTRSARVSTVDTRVSLVDSTPSENPAAVPVEPTPADQTATEYGDIGAWMLQRNGEIADYGGVPSQGKTVLEAVNVIIVDQTSTNALAATWRLDAAMRRAGFPPRLIHSTGFRGLIDDTRYRQKPGGFLVGYSDDFFLVQNNHGRIFGPDPVETSRGYVWSGAFSTEDLAVVDGLLRHVYVSSNQARDALAADLVAGGRAQLIDHVSLGNSYNTDTLTTGDHDGYAVVIMLTDRVANAAAEARSPNARGCTLTSTVATYATSSQCVAVVTSTGTYAGRN